jgi:hypothetical protein
MVTELKVVWVLSTNLCRKNVKVLSHKGFCLQYAGRISLCQEYLCGLELAVHTWTVMEYMRPVQKVSDLGPGSGVMNKLGYYHDAASSYVHHTAPVPCTELYHKDDRGLLGSTPYWQFDLVVYSRILLGQTMNSSLWAETLEENV